jgi:hypothetical protein
LFAGRLSALRPVVIPSWKDLLKMMQAIIYHRVNGIFLKGIKGGVGIGAG